MTLLTATVDTPFGDMSLIGTEECLHVASFDADLDELRDRLAPPLRRAADPSRRDRRRPPRCAPTSRATSARSTRSPSASRAARSTPGCGPRCARCAPGTTVSYAELAARAGGPRAVRAAGSACARNAICLFVPCHRIVRSDGGLGGYYYGLATKQRLLEHESVTER